eukprot:5258973-Lingulodinium_polyedra.AAC.1
MPAESSISARGTCCAPGNVPKPQPVDNARRVKHIVDTCIVAGHVPQPWHVDNARRVQHSADRRVLLRETFPSPGA